MTRWFLVAMSLFPEAQRTAQTELDTVLGENRLPNASDILTLPYIRAIVMEVMRWAPITPLGASHRLLVGKDDEYEGYSIPGGSTIIPVR